MEERSFEVLTAVGEAPRARRVHHNRISPRSDPRAKRARGKLRQKPPGISKTSDITLGRFPSRLRSPGQGLPAALRGHCVPPAPRSNPRDPGVWGAPGGGWPEGREKIIPHAISRCHRHSKIPSF